MDTVTEYEIMYSFNRVDVDWTCMLSRNVFGTYIKTDLESHDWTKTVIVYPLNPVSIKYIEPNSVSSNFSNGAIFLNIESIGEVVYSYMVERYGKTFAMKYLSRFSGNSDGWHYIPVKEAIRYLTHDTNKINIKWRWEPVEYILI